VRYGGPHCLVNALAGTIIGRPFHPRNQRFPDNCFFTADDTDVRRLPLMPFPFICGILFIRVICGSPGNCSF
jgi:hypothetical protein